ncbi:MAG: ribosomal RNA small subunit methyltransferase A [Phycisphaerae bacterium]|nr:ribosomal RNA small subunit methyltransferase A [Phycisphaerae bacterium]
MQTKHKIQQLLASAGAWPNKKYGQNFLIDLNLIGLLVERASISSDDVVLEIGCGTGSLTEELAKAAGRVICVDIDTKLAKIADGELRDFANAEIVNTDILASKHHISQAVLEKIAAARGDCGGRLLLVANLPYSVGTAAMMNLISGDVFVDAMYVTVQKEVALRMNANTGTEYYGSISILMGATGEVDVFRILKPSVFWPAPQVESAMVSYKRDPAKVGRIKDLGILSECIGIFMGHRRKMVKACTKFATGRLGEVSDWLGLFGRVGISGEIRPEQITPDEYVELANLCCEHLNEKK